jgi:hypothetical protein
VNELDFLSCIFVLAALLSRFTINPRVFNYIKWGLFVSTATLSLIILNSDTVAAMFSQLAQFLESQGIGHPKSWRIRSKYDDDVISACYYLTFFSAWICLLVSATNEHKDINKARAKNIWHLVAVVFILGFCLFDIFFGEGYSSSRHNGRVLNAFYNSQITLVAHLFITINALAFSAGYVVRATFSKTNN